MTTTVVALGDALPVLQALPRADSAACGDDDASSHVRTVVWGADLAALSPRRARMRLKQAAAEALDAVLDRPGISRLIVVFVRDARASAIWRVGEAIASRLCAQAVRRRGRDFDVIVVDASDCDDAALLCDRIAESGALRAGTIGDVALEWDDIRGQSIRRAAADHSL
ncbi:hypothetical protein [Microbacterium sp. No. 7]|uniref:hypothetical protein n=1 Tax=Microbacterium sp. No. 7 TaxID=1714373 RepID=UPI0006D0DEFB|nr:hypothetical protein [Microbacterium sp. No. 7]ALJ18629.1 hypothetical protein AOA12_01350 [Microbacterium sp. No. 7]